jgi:hypothetical protein
LVTEWKIVKRVEEQFNAFMSGFNELIPPDLVNVFDERELELLIGGIADIDVDDWKKHTDYRGYQEQDEVIQNFWKIVRTWDAEQKSRLLQFTTGTSRIPVNGFKDLQGSDGPRRFTIEKSGDPNALPKSHTWYVLPPHPPHSTLLTPHQLQPSRPTPIQDPRYPGAQDVHRSGGNPWIRSGIERPKTNHTPHLCPNAEHSYPVILNPVTPFPLGSSKPPTL